MDYVMDDLSERELITLIRNALDIMEAKEKDDLRICSYLFRDPALLTSGELAIILSKAQDILKWLDDVKEHALSEIQKGRKVEGWKVIERKGNRKWADEDAVVEVVKAAGFDPYEHKVLGIGKMTELLGEEKFEALLGNLMVRSEGKSVLVPEKGRRTAKAAEDDQRVISTGH